MKKMIYDVLNEMSEILSAAQLKRLQETMLKYLENNETEPEPVSNNEYLRMFIEAKKIEGYSERTIGYYDATIKT